MSIDHFQHNWAEIQITSHIKSKSAAHQAEKSTHKFWVWMSVRFNTFSKCFFFFLLHIKYNYKNKKCKRRKKTHTHKDSEQFRNRTTTDSNRGTAKVSNWAVWFRAWCCCYCCNCTSANKIFIYQFYRKLFLLESKFHIRCIHQRENVVHFIRIHVWCFDCHFGVITISLASILSLSTYTVCAIIENVWPDIVTVNGQSLIRLRVMTVACFCFYFFTIAFVGNQQTKIRSSLQDSTNQLASLNWFLLASNLDAGNVDSIVCNTHGCSTYHFFVDVVGNLQFFIVFIQSTESLLLVGLFIDIKSIQLDWTIHKYALNLWPLPWNCLDHDPLT